MGQNRMVEPKLPDIAILLWALLVCRGDRKTEPTEEVVNRTEAVAFERKVNDVADRRHLRVVPVDPQLLYDYIEHQSYQSWVESEQE